MWVSVFAMSLSGHKSCLKLMQLLTGEREVLVGMPIRVKGQRTWDSDPGATTLVISLAVPVSSSCMLSLGHTMEVVGEKSRKERAEERRWWWNEVKRL